MIAPGRLKDTEFVERWNVPLVLVAPLPSGGVVEETSRFVMDERELNLDWDSARLRRMATEELLESDAEAWRGRRRHRQRPRDVWIAGLCSGAGSPPRGSKLRQDNGSKDHAPLRGEAALVGANLPPLAFGMSSKEHEVRKRIGVTLSRADTTPDRRPLYGRLHGLRFLP